MACFVVWATAQVPHFVFLGFRLSDPSPSFHLSLTTPPTPSSFFLVTLQPQGPQATAAHLVSLLTDSLPGPERPFASKPITAFMSRGAAAAAQQQ